MGILSHLKLRNKLALLLALSTVAMVAIGVAGAATLHRRMLDDRVDKLRAQVSAAVSLAKALEARAVSGDLTRQQARELFHQDVRAIRYDDGVGYVSVVDMQSGNVVMHGVNPALEGKPSVSPVIADAVRTSEQGTASYLFPKPGQTEKLRKTVAVARFSPWDIAIYAGAYTDDLDTAFEASETTAAAIGGPVLLLTLLAAWLINRDIGVSIGRLKSAMEQLARGDLAASVPGAGRRDEVGGMAAAVVVFKNSMTDAARLRAEQEAAKRAAAAEQAADQHAMANVFEGNIGRLVGIVSQRSAELQNTAQAMDGSARQSERQAAAVASAAQDASSGLQAVASAAEELTASVGEISRQVAESSKITGKAVDNARHANGIVHALAESAERIGAVLSIISDIASQTNLLALNATIEAARAGDAGKGFSVVASEVKNLAGQTARATQEIDAQIACIQAATNEAVAAIRDISSTIDQVSTIATVIASAVEQQGAATSEIARNVHQTAVAAQQVTVSISSVSHAANETGEAAGLVLTAASDLTGQADRLSKEVTTFLAGVRAA
jgi:methyl-accepting chemotaxis protein